MDPRSGAVLALASWPSHDNALYGPPRDPAGLASASGAPGDPMLNHAIASAVPPGSTYKLVNASADMVHPVIPPERVIPTGGSFTYGDHTFNNWRVLPPQNLVDAIAWSNDVYFYQLAVALGPQAMIDTAHALGVGSPTGIDLPGESSGYLGSPAGLAAAGGTWYPGTTVILGIGQGPIQVTPLQDARWTAAVTTGALATPYVGMSIGTGAGSTVLPHAPPTPLPFAGQLGPVLGGHAGDGHHRHRQRPCGTRGAGRGEIGDRAGPVGARRRGRRLDDRGRARGITVAGRDGPRAASGRGGARTRSPSPPT
jgi:cell division protein FtsI/penicillin-binding protein 2